MCRVNKCLKGLEEWLESVAEHEGAANYPSLDMALLERLDEFSYEITLPQIRGLIRDVRKLEETLSKCLLGECSVPPIKSVVRGQIAVSNTAPLRMSLRRLRRKCQFRAAIYFCAILSIILLASLLLWSAL